MARDSLRSTVRDRWVRRATAGVLLGLAAVIAFAQGGVLPAAFGGFVGLFAVVALYRYRRGGGG
jgi:apolipoprotein N-acyltransferase